MTPEARIPGWGWIILLGSWTGFGTLVLRESPLPVEATAAILFLAGSVYSISHCWRNPYITLRDKFNWFAAILVTWILAATAYLVWWHLRGSTRTGQVAPVDRAAESAARFNELASARKIARMGIVLTIAWLLLGAVVLLFVLGRTLSSPEVVVPLTFGLVLTAVAMIWALRVVEALDDAVPISRRMTWMIAIVSTWLVGATLFWTFIRTRCAD